MESPAEPGLWAGLLKRSTLVTTEWLEDEIRSDDGSDLCWGANPRVLARKGISLFILEMRKDGNVNIKPLGLTGIQLFSFLDVSEILVNLQGCRLQSLLKRMTT